MSVATSSSRPALALAATFTADPLLPLLRDALESAGAPHRVESAPYGQLAEQLLSPAGLFARNTGGINVGLVRTADWTTDQTAELAVLAKEFAARYRTPTALVLCPGPERAPGPDQEPKEAPEEEPAAPRLAGALAGVPGLAVVDAAAWLRAYGCREVHDPHGAEIAHVPYTEEAFAALAVGITRLVHSTLVRPRKVIAVDCDDTLWGGACGDRPPADLELAERHLAVQRILRGKYEQGFVLALCSRNDEDSVERVFAERAADMPLSRAHFVASRVNWKPKSENIVSLAAELRLSADSFVLVDDNPYVCAEVAGALPSVAVLHVGAETDPPAVLADAWELDRFFSTPEDRSRNAGYRADALRREVAAETAGPGTAGLNERLGTVIVVRRAGPADLPRTAQLIARTNQFASGTTTDIAGPDTAGWVATLRDRFGDYGTVAAAFTARHGDAVHVESFAMSCRALDRGVIEALFDAVCETEHTHELHVRFRDTGRNGPALAFLQTRGHVHGSAGEERTYVVGAALTPPATEGSRI